MKKLIVLISMLAVAFFSQAQTFDEWFRQKKTELTYYAQQIAALEAYASDVVKGYRLAEAGLTFIGNAKKGEFNLHQAYFSSLQAVNPKIAQYSKIAAIIAYQLAIVNDFKSALNSFNNGNRFTAAELGYLNNVYSHLSDETTENLDELIDILTDGTLTLKDDERIRRIDAIYTDMQDKYTFTQSFAGQTQWLAAQRTADQNDLQSIQTIH